MQRYVGRFMSPTGNVQKELVVSPDGSFVWTLHSHFQTPSGPSQATGEVRADGDILWLDVATNAGANPDLKLTLFRTEDRRLLVPMSQVERYVETPDLSLGLLELHDGEQSALEVSMEIQARQRMAEILGD